MVAASGAFIYSKEAGPLLQMTFVLLIFCVHSENSGTAIQVDCWIEFCISDS